MFFGKKLLGIITKTDLCEDPGQIESARELLLLAGVENVIEVGFNDDDCIDAVRDWLEKA